PVEDLDPGRPVARLEAPFDLGRLIVQIPVDEDAAVDLDVLDGDAGGHAVHPPGPRRPGAGRQTPVAVSEPEPRGHGGLGEGLVDLIDRAADQHSGADFRGAHSIPTSSATGAATHAVSNLFLETGVEQQARALVWRRAIRHSAAMSWLLSLNPWLVLVVAGLFEVGWGSGVGCGGGQRPLISRGGALGRKSTR